MCARLSPAAKAARTPIKRERYAEVVEAAGRLFAAQGFTGTSLQDIADELGMLKGSLYHYITSKEELLAEVVHEGQNGMKETMAIAERFAPEPLAQLIAFSYVHVCLSANADRLTRGIVFNRDGDKLDPARREALVRNRDEYERYLRDILREGQELGLLDAEMDLRTGTLLVVGSLNSFQRWYQPQGRLSPDQLGREVAGFVLAAVRNHTANNSANARWAQVDEVIDRARVYLEEAERERAE